MGLADRNIRRHFDNIDSKWFKCRLCGQIYYPEADTVEADDGYRYCTWHNTWKTTVEALDEVTVDVTDNLD